MDKRIETKQAVNGKWMVRIETPKGWSQWTAALYKTEAGAVKKAERDLEVWDRLSPQK